MDKGGDDCGEGEGIVRFLPAAGCEEENGVGVNLSGASLELLLL